MQKGHENQSSIGVRVVGWTGVGSPMVRVPVDGVSVGILKDKQASRFSVPVGHHRVQVQRLHEIGVLGFDFRAGQ